MQKGSASVPPHGAGGKEARSWGTAWLPGLEGDIQNRPPGLTGSASKALMDRFNSPRSVRM